MILAVTDPHDRSKLISNKWMALIGSKEFGVERPNQLKHNTIFLQKLFFVLEQRKD